MRSPTSIGRRSCAGAVLRFAVGATLLTAALNVAFLACTVLVQGLDGSRMEASLRRSAALGALSAEAWPEVRIGHGVFTLDRFTDCLALSTAIDGPEPSALRRAVEARMWSRVTGNPCENLVGYVRDGAPWDVTPYFRYWHGYQVYLRPMLLVWDVATIRVASYALAGICAIVVGALMLVLFPWPVPVVLLVSLAVLTDAIVVPLVTSHVAGMLVALLTCAATLVALRSRNDGVHALPWIAVVSGAVFNFLDFLVNPPFTPALMGFVALAAWFWRGSGPGRCGRDRLREAWVIMAVWFAAYAATWAAKWAVSAIVLGGDVVVGDIVEAVRRRAGGAGGAATVHIGAATLENLDMIRWSWVAAYAIATATAFAVLVARHGAAGRRLAELGMLASPALVPLVWIEALRGHSVEHALFAYRSVALSLVIPLVAVILMWVKARSPTARSGSPGR